MSTDTVTPDLTAARPFRVIRGKGTDYRTSAYKTQERRDEAAARFASLDGEDVLAEFIDRDGVWWLDRVAPAPTVPAQAPTGTVEDPRCPECGNIPDRHRATCLTCLRG